jgi:hypothetical protein
MPVHLASLAFSQRQVVPGSCEEKKYSVKKTNAMATMMSQRGNIRAS